MKLFARIIMFFFAAFLSSMVYAVALPDVITNAIDPGLVQKRMEAVLPTPAATRAAPKISEPQAPSGITNDKIKFKLNGVKFKGNTVYSSQELEQIFKPYFNTTISLTDLQNRVNDVTVKYRTAGYVLSRAILPPQTIQGGVVTVQVIEGFVSNVTVTGNVSMAASVVNKYSKPVLSSRPLQISTLERSLLLMNDLPGVSVKAVLTPSKTIPGAAELTLVGEQKRFNAYTSYDNYGTRYLGPQEFGAGASVNSFIIPGASDGVQYMTVPNTKELQFWQFVHTNPIGSYGTKFTFDYTYTGTNPQFILSDFDVKGKSQLAYIDIAHPIIRSRSQNLFVHGAFNYQNVSSTILNTLLYNDLFRTLDLGADYNFVDSWRGYNDMSLDFEKGFDIWGSKQHLNQSRPKGIYAFTKFDVNLSRLQALPWQFGLLAAMTGQYSCNPLLATEQFAYGGPIWGRGYNPSEIVGDDGVGAKLELQRTSTYALRWLYAVQYYLFYDAGIIWNRDGINMPPKQSATSTGVGTRITFIPQLTGNLFYAKPLTHSLATQVAMGKDPFKPGIYFQLVASI